MRSTRAPFRLPLQAQIGLVFIALILLIGAALALVSYRQISGLILASTDELFDEIAVGIGVRFQQEYRPLTKTVELLSMTRLVQSSALSEQLAALPLLAEALHNQPNVTSIMFGYPDGTYLVARSTRSQHVRRAFMIPPRYTYIIDRLTPDGAGGMVGERRFFDDGLQLGEVVALSASEFDPRERPWYRNTEHTAETRLTEPYYFYFTRQPGVTVSRRDFGDQSAVQQQGRDLCLQRPRPGRGIP